MTLLPTICHAYFLAKDVESNFLQAGYKVDGNRIENTFVLYDDINLLGSDKKQIIFPQSKFFIPVDLISVAFPLPVVFYNYTSTDNVLADLIYANLKLKKIIDEYKNIQDRSQQLTWGSQNLFKQKDSTESIYQIAERRKKSFKQTVDESGLVLNYQKHTMGSSQSHFLKPTSSISQIQVNNTWAAQNYARTPPNNTDGERSTSRKNSNNPSMGGSDPFIVKIFIGLANIIPYLITHKGEAVFYGIGLTLMFLFFSLIFRR